MASGSCRVKVYAGWDLLTGRSLYLTETVPAGPDVAEHAEAVRERLVAAVARGDHPRTDGTIAELLDWHLAEVKLGRKTRATYLGYHRKHITPLLGKLKINGGLDDLELLDSFYAELARCRDHCNGRPTVTKHWTPAPHTCGQRCKWHVCRPLKDWTIRKIHWMLHSAYQRAIRRKWAITNPLEHAEPPPPPQSQPCPPSTSDTARIINAVWNRVDYDRMVWVAIMTGARLGELCALRWRDFEVEHVDPSHAVNGQPGSDCAEQGCQWVLSISRSIEQVGLDVWETDTKTHQHRRVALDPTAVAVLLDLYEVREVGGRVSGRSVDQDDFIFHHRRGPEVCLRPGAVSTHYTRFTAKLGIVTTFHKLRHYSATELIIAGVDIRTVAGRLGHSGGGTTTLKVYAAWVSEADQRAAHTLAARVPAPPKTNVAAKKLPRFAVLTETLRKSILQGQFEPDSPLPTMKDLASAYQVSINAAHAAVGQLASWGYVMVSRGKRAIVTPTAQWPAPPQASTEHQLFTTYQVSPLDGATANDLAPVVGHIGTTTGPTDNGYRDAAAGGSASDTELLQVTLRCDGNALKTLCTEADIANPADIQRLVRDIAAILPDDLTGMLELDFARFGSDEPVLTYVMGQATVARQRLLAAG